MANKQRKTAVHKKGPAAEQRRAWEEMCTLSAAWNGLTGEQRGIGGSRESVVGYMPLMLSLTSAACEHDCANRLCRC